jgi:hypothetical protein
MTQKWLATSSTALSCAAVHAAQLRPGSAGKYHSKRMAQSQQLHCRAPRSFNMLQCSVEHKHRKPCMLPSCAQALQRSTTADVWRQVSSVVAVYRILLTMLLELHCAPAAQALGRGRKILLKDTGF